MDRWIEFVIRMTHELAWPAVALVLVSSMARLLGRIPWERLRVVKVAAGTKAPAVAIGFALPDRRPETLTKPGT